MITDYVVKLECVSCGQDYVRLQTPKAKVVMYGTDNVYKSICSQCASPGLARKSLALKDKNASEKLGLLLGDGSL